MAVYREIGIMGIEIHIQLGLTPWQRKLVRWGVVAGVVLACLGAGLAVGGTAARQPTTDLDETLNRLQAEVTALQTFQTEATADAGYFANLQSQITTIQTSQAQATATEGYSLGATYCGVTRTPTEGSFRVPGDPLTGYAAAKSQCEEVSTCSRTAAHMCTADDLLRTVQRGRHVSLGTNTAAWYASGVQGQGTASVVANDCGGWTTSSGNAYGSSWTVSGGRDSSSLTACRAVLPILCCS
jgi:hypothetical protein